MLTALGISKRPTPKRNESLQADRMARVRLTGSRQSEVRSVSLLPCSFVSCADPPQIHDNQRRWARRLA